jgi:hypothetical protein
MNFKVIPLLALATLPALANEKWQVGLGFNHTDAVQQDYVANTSLTRCRQESETAPSLQAGYRFKEYAHSDLTVTGEYQFSTSSNTRVNSRGTTPAANFDGSGKLDKAFLAPGIMWTFHPTIDIGLGLQYRFERLHAHGDATGGGTTASWDRPWFNFYLGYTFQNLAKVKPYIAVRSSAALVTARPPALADLNSDWGKKRLMRSMAGNVESCFQVGVRF